MDENHDGKISQAEFVEVKIGHNLGKMVFIRLLGLSCPEEVFYNVDSENNWRVYNRRSTLGDRKNQIEN